MTFVFHPAVRQLLNVGGELPVALPELPVGTMPHRSVQRPSGKSRNASSANPSSRPACTVSSNCRSQVWASSSKNQVRKTESSSRDKLLDCGLNVLNRAHDWSIRRAFLLASGQWPNVIGTASSERLLPKRRT